MNLDNIINSEKPTMINFHATWCGPCHMMKPNLDEVVEEFGADINYNRIDIDEHMELANHFQVRSVPTTIIFKDGQSIWRQSGVYPSDEIKKVIKELL